MSYSEKFTRGARAAVYAHQLAWVQFLFEVFSEPRTERPPACLQILAHTRFNSTRFCKHSAKRDWLGRLYLQRYFLAIPPSEFCYGQ